MPQNALRRLLVVVAAVLPLAAAAQVAVPAQGYPPPPPGYPPPQAYPPPPAYPPPGAAPAPVAAYNPTFAGEKGRFTLEAYYGWFTSSDIYLSGGTLRISDTDSIGVSALFNSPAGSVELKWVYANPEMQLTGYGYGNSSSNKFHVAENWFQIGGQQSVRRGRMEPFFGATVGALYLQPGDFTVANTAFTPSSTWVFAFTVGGGARVYLSEKVALRLGIELMAPVYWSGGGVYMGTGGGGMYFSGGIPSYTGNFTAGLSFSP